MSDQQRPWVAGGPAAPTEPDAWIAWFVSSVDQGRLRGFVDEAVGTAVAGTHEVSSDPALRHDLEAMASESLVSFLEVLGTGCAARTPPAAAAFARTLARRGLDVAVMLKIYRLGQSFFWRVTMEESERFVADPMLRNRVLSLMWERLNRWLETLLDDLSAIYDDERSRWLRGAAAGRSQAIRDVIAGGEVDSDRTSRQLGYELRRHHTALILWAEGAASGETVTALENIAHGVAAALGAGRALTEPAGSSEVWAWIGTTGDIDAQRLVESVSGHASVRVAIGRNGQGANGFRQSHIEALAAQRVALADLRHPACTSYDDVEIVALMSLDPNGMRELIRHELAALAGDGPGVQALRETALAYLRLGSATAASRELATHKNTVRHRLERIEGLLGHPIEERRLQLEVALMLAEVFGAH